MKTKRLREKLHEALKGNEKLYQFLVEHRLLTKTIKTMSANIVQYSKICPSEEEDTIDTAIKLFMTGKVTNFTIETKLHIFTLND